MARTRTIKPDVMDDEKSAGLSSDAWRLWVCMWMLADDKGRARANTQQLKARVFWATPHDVNVGDLIEELASRDCIKLYEHDGQPFAEIVNFSKHQKIDKPSNWTFPESPSNDSSNLQQKLAEYSESGKRVVDDHSAPKEKEKEKEKVIQKKHTSPSAPQHVLGEQVQGLKFDPPSKPSGFDFEAVYALYPKKLGHKKGIARCKSQIKTREKYDALLRAVGNYAAVAVEPYVKQFDTFMGCWEDYVDAGKLTPRGSSQAKTGMGGARAAVAETKREDDF